MGKFAISGISAVLMVLAATAVAPPAEAKCMKSQENGEWTNIDPVSWTITRIKLGYRCKDVILGDEYAWSGPTWYVEPFSNCGDNECSWGKTGAEQSLRDYKRRNLSDERSEDVDPIRVNPVFASFDWEGFRRYLYIHMSPEEEGLLIVRVYSEYQQGRYEMEDLAFRTDRLKGAPFTLRRE